MNSMLGKLSGLGVSIESQPPMPVDTPAPEMPVDMDTESLSMVDAAADELSTAVTKHDQLQALATTLESMVQTDGMSDTEYALFNHAVDGICADTPIDTAVPSMESFAHASDRLRNANVALESVSDKLKATGEWIAKKVKEFIEWVAASFSKMIASLNGVEKKLEEMDFSALDRHRNIEVPASSIRFVESLSLEGKMPNHLSEALEQAGAWGNIMQGLVGEIAGMVAELRKPDIENVITDDYIKKFYDGIYSTVSWTEEAGDKISKEILGGYFVFRPNGGAPQIKKLTAMEPDDYENYHISVSKGSASAEGDRRAILRLTKHVAELEKEVMSWTRNLNDTDHADSNITLATWHLQKFLMSVISSNVMKYCRIVQSVCVAATSTLATAIKVASR